MKRAALRDLKEERNKRQREAARAHLLDFTMYTFPQYKPDAAHRLIASKLDEVVAGQCKRLMIFAPPQSGKTELVSVRLPAFWLGKRPNDPVIMCTYGASLAHNKSRLSRAVVESDEYAELFPNISTDPSSRAVDHWELAHPNRGGLLATGVGGPVTGHGGMCFPAGTMITTSEGQVDIAELYGRRSWPAILTYNEKAGILEWGRIVGTHSQVDEELIEVTTNDGRTFCATPTHPVFCEGRGYVEAQSLAAGDTLVQAQGMRDLRRESQQESDDLLVMLYQTPEGYYQDPLCPVWRDHRTQPARVRQEAETGPAERVLFQNMRQPLQGRSEPEGMCPLWEKENQESWRLEQEVLLERMPGCSTVGSTPSKELSPVRRGIHSQNQEDSLLQQGLCRHGAFGADEGQGQFPLQKRRQLCPMVQEDAPPDPGAGWVHLRQLRAGAGDQANCVAGQKAAQVELGNPPHRRGCRQQQGREPGYPLRDLSCPTPQLRTVSVAMVRRVRTEGIRVYDLQVANTHNYFANSILVHNCGIIDDPFENWEQAYSPTIRKKVWEWWRGTFRTRIWEGGTIILIQTRWHEDDLAGRILLDQGEEWEVLRLAAVGETQGDRDARNENIGLASGLPDPLNRQPGEALTPSRFSIGALATIKRDVGTLVWESQYMGSPTLPEGNRFKREWFKLVDQAPANMDVVWYWDKAGTAEDEGEAAYTAGVKVGGPDTEGLYYVIQVQRGRWSALQRERVIRQTAELEADLEWNEAHDAFTIRHPGPPIHYEQEPGSGGKESAEATMRSLAGFQAYPDRVTGDKDVRLEPFAVQMEAGNVRIVRGPWNGEYIDEMCAVPFGKYRDMADATAGGFNKLAGAASSKFVQIDWWDACKESLPEMKDSEPLVIGLYAAKGEDPTLDSTFAVIAVTRHPGRSNDVAVRYAGIWQPTEGQQINYDEVENAIRGLCQRYQVAEVAYLKAQLHDMANRLRREGMARFREFSSESERIRADRRLQDLIAGRRLAHDGNPLLREHLDHADIEKRGQEGIRIVPRSPVLRCGAAIALAMACDRSLYYNLG